jgi:DNA polymerase-3 subunit gamma/tau
MTDGSLFNLDAVEPAPAADPATDAPAGSADSPGGTVTTPAARDAAAPTSLYRKYRPQSFDADELVGQEHIVNTLRNAIALDRIAHAYLFCGPRGTGKTTTARLLAKAVNCQDPDPLRRPCNRCQACVAINTGATTDVIEIDAASNRGIDDIRDLRERVKYAPSQLTTKFYIIDEAHQITGAAANAFLKTLEEPPPHTKFILATTDPEELLATIVSRCQRFDFRRIGLEATMSALTRVANAENIDIDDEAKAAIARHATGSMRDALGLLDQVAVYRENVDDTGTTVTIDLVRTVLGVSNNERVEGMATALADRDAGAGLRAVAEAVENGDDIRQLARQLLAYMRQLLLERAGGVSDLDDAGKALAGRFEIGELADLTRLMGDIDFKVKHATISQLPLEVAIVEGALRGSLPQPAAAQAPSPAQQVAPAQQYQQPAPHQAPAPTPPQPQAPRKSWTGKVRNDDRGADAPAPALAPSRPQPAPRATTIQETPPAPRPQAAQASAAPAPNGGGPLDIERLVDGWGQVKADVKAVNRRIEALLQQIDPVSITGSTLTLVSPYEFHRNRVNTDEVRKVIEDVLIHRFGVRMTIMCVTRSELQAMPAPAPASAPAPQASAPATPQPSDDPAPQVTTDPPPVIDTEKQIEAAKNIFDAELEEVD